MDDLEFMRLVSWGLVALGSGAVGYLIAGVRKAWRLKPSRDEEVYGEPQPLDLTNLAMPATVIENRERLGALEASVMRLDAADLAHNERIANLRAEHETHVTASDATSTMLGNAGEQMSMTVAKELASLRQVVDALQAKINLSAARPASKRPKKRARAA